MKKLSLLPCLSLGAGLACAQMPPAPALPPEHEPVSLEEFVVSASPFGRAQDEIVQPTSVLAGQRLIFARQASLGETLVGQPGISSTYFGPGASRPVIRGLGGDRIRVLTGGIGTLDASVISPDHAVSIDPLLIDRIEIVRGPATLLYGGSAIGGVVNVIDARIPESLPAAPLQGRVEARLGSAAEERAGAAVLTGAAGRLAWRLDGFRRTTDDVRIPDYAETAALLADHDAAEEGPPARDILPNTASETSGAGFGVSFLGERGHVGLSYTGLDALYGVPGHTHHEDHGGAPPDPDHDHEEEGVRLDLRQRRVDLHAEWLEPAAWLRAVKLQFGAARYRHDELEGDEIGTRFRNRAHEGRLEFLHEKIGAAEGALGVQVSRSDFEAAGDEAFVPPSVTRNQAVFLYEEIALASGTWQLGARVERQEIDPDSADAPRRHTGVSWSAGWIRKLDERHTLALSVTRSERAPNAQELYADGPHAGTGSYEIGDAALGLERSLGVDLSLRRRQDRFTGSVTLFASRFSGYIFEQDTGLVSVDEELPIYRFVQRDARFAGVEIELIAHLHESRHHQADFRVTLDSVRGTNRTDGTPLPRITPLRVAWALDYRVPGWAFTAELRRSARADRTAPGESITDSFSSVNVAVSRRLQLGRADAELFLRGSNLLDRTGRLHTSFLKDIAPLPGRDVTAGLRFAF
ncbi:MAG: TonB-dependent receptor [Candidatus Didemnitutus sp.]|nr:TonB-dependent receptor [Candidatus Didemnitutus sp.]